MNTDTPLPPDEALGENPPDGAMIDYFLARPSEKITLAIKDTAGSLVRQYSSDDPIPPPNPKLNIPTYWVRPPQRLPGSAGLHRFLWDMHYTPVAGIELNYPMAAVYANTAPAPTSPWALPGDYSVTLTVDGKSYTQPLTLKIDPRVKAPREDLVKQFEALKKLSQNRRALEGINKQLEPLMAQVEKAKDAAGKNPVAQHRVELIARVEAFGGGRVEPGEEVDDEHLGGRRGTERRDQQPGELRVALLKQ
jgi:hypothetical protein